MSNQFISSFSDSILSKASLKMSPCSLLLGDFLDLHDEPSDCSVFRADVVFCYCSTWPAYQDFLTGLSFILGGKLKLGTLVITTDRKLASTPGVWEFDLMDRKIGKNPETGGESVAYIWKLILKHSELV